MLLELQRGVRLAVASGAIVICRVISDNNLTTCRANSYIVCFHKWSTGEELDIEVLHYRALKFALMLSSGEI